jgi:hypothetical protein
MKMGIFEEENLGQENQREGLPHNVIAVQFQPLRAEASLLSQTY